jgi:NADP-dependent 3-hydroxy acid dehydrogenase YdfG
MTSPQPRIALVTGASSGIGRASAIALNDAGWIVVLTARRKDALEETIAMMGDKKHPKTLAVEADVAVVKDVERLFQVVKKEFGGCQPDSHHEAWSWLWRVPVELMHPHQAVWTCSST